MKNFGLDFLSSFILQKKLYREARPAIDPTIYLRPGESAQVIFSFIYSQ